LKGVQFGPSFLFFDVIYQTYKLSLGQSKLAMCFLDIFQIFFIYLFIFYFFKKFWSWGLGWDRFGTNLNLPCVYCEKVLK
jgi:glucan phosphoethanolaminetransferase (alkaline phosphatase superfamily)